VSYSDPLSQPLADDGSDDEYGRPKKTLKKRSKQPKAASDASRPEQHTLDESLEHMLSRSFEASFLDSGGGGAAGSSSFIEGGLDFGVDLDPFLSDLHIDFDGGIGDEIAKELGEGWGSAPQGNHNECITFASTHCPEVTHSSVMSMCL